MLEVGAHLVGTLHQIAETEPNINEAEDLGGT